jgi:murein DD-endopeptidase MepM/ murein hydrolase activator NlpD
LLEQTGPRHAAPREPVRPRTILLPGVLLVAAGAAFGGLAVLPAAADSAAGVARVTAAQALAPVELADVTANVELYTALSQGAVIANKPKPAPSVAPSVAPSARAAAEQASRSRPAPDPTVEGLSRSAKFARPGIGRLTSSYGRRWGRLHAGIDLASGIGSPVRAVAAGVVQSSGSENGYGRAVRIRHSDGTVTVYAHMSALLVRSGEQVSAGEKIGREGNTGHSTGPHLHFEVRVNGSPLNPIPWLRARGIVV